MIEKIMNLMESRPIVLDTPAGKVTISRHIDKKSKRNRTIKLEMPDGVTVVRPDENGHFDSQWFDEDGSPKHHQIEVNSDGARPARKVKVKSVQSPPVARTHNESAVNFPVPFGQVPAM